eukprot:Ihof_evm1s331 gene=Ihof_evmTU1s331
MRITACTVTCLCFLAGRWNYSPLWVFIAVWVLHGLFGRYNTMTYRQMEQEEKRTYIANNPDKKTEQALWFNEVVHRVYQYAAPILENTISKSVEGILDYSKPGLVKGFQFKEFHLGRNGPKFSEIQAYPQSEDTVLRQDMKISLVEPNCRLRLAIKLASPIGGLPKPVLNVEIKDIVFNGTMTIDAKLQPGFPYAEILKIGFKERPEVKLDIKPMGMEITALPWLGEWIYNAIEQAIQDSMVEQPLEINLDTILNPKRELNAEGVAVGILVVDIIEGINLPRVDNGIDAYVRCTVDTQRKHTHVVPKLTNPTWSRTFRFLVHKMDTVNVVFDLLDKNAFNTDEGIMSWTFSPTEVDTILCTPEKSEHTLEMVSHNGITASIKIATQFYISADFEDPYDTESLDSMPIGACASNTQLSASDLNLNSNPNLNGSGSLNSLHNQSAEPLVPNSGSLRSLADKDNVQVVISNADMHEAVVTNVDDVLSDEEEEDEELWQSGILRLYIHEGKKLRSESGAQYLQPYVTVHMHERNTYKDGTIANEVSNEDGAHGTKLYRTKLGGGNDPTFDELCEVIIVNRDQDRITLRCKNKMVAGTEDIGDIIINVGAYLRTTNTIKKRWFKFSDNRGNGQLLLSLYFANMDLGIDNTLHRDLTLNAKAQRALAKKLGITGKMEGSLHLTIHEARKLKAADRGGTSDPFVTVRIKKVKVAQTIVVHSSLSPVWDENFTLPLPDTKGINILFEVWDWDRVTPATSLGDVWVDLSTLQLDDFGLPYYSGWLKLDRVREGQLRVTICYQPPGFDGQRRVMKRKSLTTGPLATQSSNNLLLPSSGSDAASVHSLHTLSLSPRQSYSDHPHSRPVTPAGAGELPTTSLLTSTSIANNFIIKSTMTTYSDVPGLSPNLSLRGDKGLGVLEVANEEEKVMDTNAESLAGEVFGAPRRQSSITRASRSVIKSKGGWGTLQLGIESGKNIPATFHPFLKVKLNGKSVTSSGQYTAQDVVDFHYVTTIPINNSPQDQTLAISVADHYTKSLGRSHVADYSIELPMSNYFSGAYAKDCTNGENTITFEASLTPSERSRELYGDDK